MYIVELSGMALRILPVNTPPTASKHAVALCSRAISVISSVKSGDEEFNTISFYCFNVYAVSSLLVTLMSVIPFSLHPRESMRPN